MVLEYFGFYCQNLEFEFKRKQPGPFAKCKEVVLPIFFRIRPKLQVLEVISMSQVEILECATIKHAAWDSREETVRLRENFKKIQQVS